MAIEEDTEWLRDRLADEKFHRQYRGMWVAARGREIVFYAEDRDALAHWIANEDYERTSVLAYADDRAFV